MISGNQLAQRMAARKTGGAAAMGKNAKTALQLEEEEMKLKAMEEEIAEMERKDRERWKRILRWVTPPDVVGIVRRAMQDKLKIQLHRLSDKNHTLEAQFEFLHLIKKKECWKFIHFWKELDDKKKNQVSYERFCKYFRLTRDHWSKRVFDLIDINMKHSFSFIDFMIFAAEYLIIDKWNTEVFSFRMISRRGQTFRPKISIIDLEDMRVFMKTKYKMKEQKAIDRNALDVFGYVDLDGDGGLYIDEWEEFNEKNSVFVKFTHCFQNHIRKVCMGIKFWVDKSRLIKKGRATGISKLTITSRSNLESEKFTVLSLKDPVIDAGTGRAIPAPDHWIDVENDDHKTDGMNHKERMEYHDLAKDIFEAEDNGSGVFSAVTPDQPEVHKTINKGKERELKKKAELLGLTLEEYQASTKKEKKEEKKEERNFIMSAKGHLVEVDENGKEIVKKEEDTRIQVAWNGPFRFTAAAHKKFEEDFTEVHIAKLKRKMRRDLEKKEKNDASKKMAGRTYKRLVKVCEDIIYARKWLRVGFNHWFEAVGMERDNINCKKTAEEIDQQQRAEGKRQMARFMGNKIAAQINESGGDGQHLTLKGKEFLKRSIAADRALKQGDMTEVELAVDLERERLEKEQDEAYILHDTILENILKQEEHYDDDDQQQTRWAIWQKEEQMKSIVSGNYYRGDELERTKDTLLRGNPNVFSPMSRAVSTRGVTRERSRGQGRANQKSRGVEAGEHKVQKMPGLHRPGSTDGNFGFSRPGSSSESRKLGVSRPNSPSRPGTAGLGNVASVNSTILFDLDGSAGEFFDDEQIARLRLEDDQFYVTDAGDKCMFPTLNTPGSRTGLRHSSPQKSYIFERPDIDAYQSDSSADL